MGTEFYTWQLVGGLVDQGHEVVILHPVRNGSQPRYTVENVTAKTVHNDAVPVYLLHNAGDPKKDFQASYQDPKVDQLFDEVLTREAPEVVHFTYLLWGLSVDRPRSPRHAASVRSSR